MKGVYLLISTAYYLHNLPLIEVSLARSIGTDQQHPGVGGRGKPTIFLLCELPMVSFSPFYPMTGISKFSLLAFSDDEIIDKADSLGVSLGSSRKSKVTAAKLIKDN
jgi:hypothetical protein